MASAQIAFRSSKSSGAILDLKHPGHRTVLECDDLIRQYMTKHIDNWYKFAKLTHRIDIRDKDIILVSGFIKTLVWYEAAWSGMKGSRNVAFDLSGGALVASGITGLEVLRGYDLKRSVVTRSGPQARLAPTVTATDSRGNFPADQCIFLSYHRAQRRRIHHLVMRAAAGPHELPPGPGRDKPGGSISLLRAPAVWLKEHFFCLMGSVALSYEPELDPVELEFSGFVSI